MNKCSTGNKQSIINETTMLLSAIFFLPFIINNLPYKDDFYKALWGQSHFISDGRPIAELILRSFSSFTSIINDTSPLTWILSFLLLGMSCAFTAEKIFCSESKVLYTSSVLIFCTPNFIDNTMYKFDNLTMSFSLSIAMLVAVYQINNKKQFTIVLLGNLIYLCSYQPSLTSYMIISLLYFCVKASESNDLKTNIYDIILKGVSLIIAIAVYNIIKPIMQISPYADKMSELANIKDMPLHFYIGVSKYFELMVSLYDKPSLVAIIICSAISFSFLIKTTLSILNSHKKSWYRDLSSLIIALAVPISLFMIFTPLAILKKQPDDLRDIIGTGSFTFLIISLSWHFTKKYKRVKHSLAVLTLIPVCYAISMCYVINNAYKAQYDFSDGISSNVLQSLSKLNISEIKEIKYTYSTDPQSFEFDGPLAFETDRVRKDYPFTKKILSDGFVAIPHWAGYKYQAKIKVGEWFNDSQTQEACRGELITNALNYDLYRKDSVVYVDLTKSKCTNNHLK